MHRRAWLAIALVFCAVFAAASALPAGADSSGPQLTATPSTAVTNGTPLQVTLTGADSYDGQDVMFMWCDLPLVQELGPQGNTCNFNGSQGFTTVSGGTATVTVDAEYGQFISDMGDVSPYCLISNNGDCGVVAFQQGSGGDTVLASTPVTFAAPAITGPGAIDVSPTTDLYNGTPVTVSSDDAQIADGINSVEIAECTVGNELARQCRDLADVTVTNNEISPQTVDVYEGYLNFAQTLACDSTTACDIGLLAPGFDQTSVLLSNFVPISFHAPGTPAVTLSAQSNLIQGQQLTVRVTGIPDEVSWIEFAECNVTAADGHYSGDSACQLFNNMAPVTNNAAQTTVDAYVGEIDFDKGTTYCDSGTNGQCEILAFPTSGASEDTPIAEAPVTFSTSDLPNVSVTPQSGLGARTNVKVTITNIEKGVEGGSVALCTTAHPLCAEANDGLEPVRLVDFSGHGTTNLVVPAGPIGPKPLSLCDFGTNGSCAIEVTIGDARVAVPVTYADDWAAATTRITSAPTSVAKKAKFTIAGFVGADDRTGGVNGARVQLYDRPYSDYPWQPVGGPQKTNSHGIADFATTGLGHAEQYAMELVTNSQGEQKVGSVILRAWAFGPPKTVGNKG